MLFIFSKNLIFPLIEKVISRTYSLDFEMCSSCFHCYHFLRRWISIWISRYSRCYWCFWYYIFFWPWQITFYFTADSGKSRNLQRLVKYFNGTTISGFNVLLSFGVLPIILFLYSKYFLLIVLSLLQSLLISIAESFISSL